MPADIPDPGLDRILFRGGDLDLGVLTFIMNKEEIGLNATNTLINKHSGMLGITGVSSDMREIETEAFENIEESKVAQAVMPKGSVLYWLQSTIHGGGANTASTPRSGMFISYSLGWVRQEDNHYLMLPKEVVDSYPDNIRRLVGYQSHGPYLGIYPGDPDDHWWDA